MSQDKQHTNKSIDYSDIPPLTDAQLAAMKPLREVLPPAMPGAAEQAPLESQVEVGEQAPLEQDDMLPEYDFTGKKGVRGKYYQE